MWSEQAGYKEYVEWALDMPMFLVKRDGQPIPNTSQTFRTFMKEGLGKHRATHGDWQTHLNTLFPEVRLKRTLEVRCADSQGLALAPALSALWLGILYDDKSLRAAEEWTRAWRFEEAQAARADVALRGINAVFRREPVQTAAIRLFELADEGLSRRARKNGSRTRRADGPSAASQAARRRNVPGGHGFAELKER